MKYEVIKEITPQKYCEAVPGDQKHCRGFWEDMIFLVGIYDSYHDEIPLSEIEPEFPNRPYLKEYLIKCGFIREAEPEVYYHVGQRFERKESHTIYVLAHVGTRLVSFVHEDFRGCKADPVKVENLDPITQAEFEKIIGASPASDFTPIEGT